MNNLRLFVFCTKVSARENSENYCTFIRPARRFRGNSMVFVYSLSGVCVIILENHRCKSDNWVLHFSKTALSVLNVCTCYIVNKVHFQSMLDIKAKTLTKLSLNCES